MIFVIFLLLGLIVGSFLNVVIYRLNVAETLVFGRSHCPHCKAIIRWYDNIPVVSFILLHFQCRSCQKNISWQYPLVELATGVIFGFCGLLFFNPNDPATWIYAAYLLVTMCFLLVIFVYDWLFMEIPDVVLWPAVAWVALFSLFFSHYGAAVHFSVLNLSLYSKFMAASFGFAFFYFLSKVSKEKWMGMGDAYLAILLGLILGWPQILLALFLAFFIGSICGIILVLGKRKSMSSQVPFAPFLVLGTTITMFYYEPIINWYLRLFYF